LCLAAALLSAQDLGSSAECRNREQNGSGREKRAEVEARNEELGPTMTTRHHPELSVHALSVHRSLIPRYHVPSAKDRQGALCLLQQAQETRQRDKRQDASQRDKHKEKKDRTSHIQKKELRRLAPVLGTDFEGKHDVIDKEGTAVQSSVDACLSSTEQRDKDPKQVIVVLVAESDAKTPALLELPDPPQCSALLLTYKQQQFKFLNSSSLVVQSEGAVSTQDTDHIDDIQSRRRRRTPIQNQKQKWNPFPKKWIATRNEKTQMRSAQ
jgi:hypothetical protein